MENRKMEIISQLMEELQDLMAPSAEDFGSRLGKEKPAVEVVKMEASEPLEMGDEDESMDDMEMEDPEEKLKQRLLKLRG